MCWKEDASGMLKSAMPKNFTEKMKWDEWKNTLQSFFRTQPGRYGIPLSYVIRDNDLPLIRNNNDFLDEYVDRAPLEGRAFIMDSTKVHLFILRLISDNLVAEQKLLPHKDDNNGRLDYLALKQFYEGVGANSKAILAAEKDLVELFYAGEKKPHMWWDEFESRLINAFAIIDKDANRVVYTDNMKLRTLNNKIRADFLTHMRTIIQMEMIKVPMTMNFAVAMTN